MTDPDGARLGRLYAERVALQDRSFPGYEAAWKRFCGLVLGHGGRLVVPPLSPDPMLGFLAERARLWDNPVAHRPLRRSECHGNAVGLWRQGDAVAIGTGYALSDDGLWRSHSWALSPEGELVETTMEREAYFGVELSGDEAERFAAESGD